MVQRKIGEGGMGVVYEALDSERQMVVALKTLRHRSPSSVMRLKREFRSLADLTHRNLVSLYELQMVLRGARRMRAPPRARQWSRFFACQPPKPEVDIGAPSPRSDGVPGVLERRLDCRT